MRVFVIFLIPLLLLACADTGGETRYTLTGTVVGDQSLSGIEVKLYSLQFEQSGLLLAVDTTDVLGEYSVSSVTHDEPLFQIEFTDPLLQYEAYREKVLDFTGAEDVSGELTLRKDIRLIKVDD